MHIFGNVMLKLWRNILISLDIRTSVYCFQIIFLFMSILFIYITHVSTNTQSS